MPFDKNYFIFLNIQVGFFGGFLFYYKGLQT
jgi:hypothetical protein